MICNNITNFARKARLNRSRPALCHVLICLGFLTVGLLDAAAQNAPKTVASIKPIHALVAGVMAGVGSPSLLVEGASSPHDFTLKPSKARELENADIIFWAGPGLETYLQKPIQTLGARAMVVALAESPIRTRPHSFLNPRAARAMVARIALALTKADPDNSPAYAANAMALTARINALIDEVAGTLAPVKSLPFFVFHDAYGAFTSAFGLNVAGALTAAPQKRPGARRIVEIRKLLQDRRGICVFAEPQINPGLVAMVTEGTPTRTGTLDPLGANLKPGPDLYFTLIRNLAKAIAECLSEGL